MTNLTISLDEKIVRDARIRALREGTSLSAKVREFLQHYVEGTESSDPTQLRRAATARLIESFAQASKTSVKSDAPSKRKGASLRETLYDGDFRARAKNR